MRIDLIKRRDDDNVKRTYLVDGVGKTLGSISIGGHFKPIDGLHYSVADMLCVLTLLVDFDDLSRKEIKALEILRSKYPYKYIDSNGNITYDAS